MAKGSSNSWIKKPHIATLFGKPKITAEGRKRLEFLRRTRELRLANIVRPRKPTKVKKRVLFVCSSGMESSLRGLKEFRGLAQKAPVDATLVLDYAGYSLNTFTRNVMRADFIVPMLPGARQRIEKVIAKMKSKPLIIDPGFEKIWDQGEIGRYQKILEEIRNNLQIKK